MTNRYSFRAPREDRLDKLLIEQLATVPPYEGITRSQLKRWIEGGQVSVDGVVATKAGFPVSDQAQIQVEVLDPSPSALSPYDYPLDIVYEDDELMVINKGAGISMHPGAGNSTTTIVNALLAHFQGKGRLPEVLQKNAVVQGTSVQRPGIVHRLDKDTTGLIVVAKTLKSHAAISSQFAARTVGRRYFALAFSTPRGKRPLNLHNEGVIDSPLSRHPVKRREMSVAKQGGKRAVTHWKVLERLGSGCVVELKLETGRTHQIRIHLSHIGCPIIGDKTYGDFSGLPLSLRRFHEEFGRQALHAAALEFNHPSSGERLTFQQPLPEDMNKLIEAFRTHVPPQ